MSRQRAKTDEDCLVLKQYGPFGQKVDTDLCALRGMLSQPRMAAFLVLIAAAFVLLDALAFGDRLSLVTQLFLWSSTLSLHVVFRMGLALGWAALQRRFGAGRIYQPVLTHLAFALDSAQFNLQLMAFTGASLAQVYDPGKTLIGYALMMIFELFFFTFVRPILLQNAAPHAPAPPAAAAPPGRQLSVGGARVPVDTLLVLKSQAHHIDVVHDGGALRLRARLSDVVNQTAPEDGVLAHRSHWVARRAIAGLDRGSGNGSDTLLLVTGERLPVARPRRAAVRDWAREHLPQRQGDAAQ